MMISTREHKYLSDSFKTFQNKVPYQEVGTLGYYI